MHTRDKHTELDLDAIFGLPRPTRKPSTLKKPRQPPAPKHINKERALAIAKKFNIQQIGKVSVRAGRSDALDDPPKVSLQSEKVLTRRVVFDREKGLGTAKNTKDSAVGKCILGQNDYESRKLGVKFDKLDEDSERKSYELLKRKSVFVQQRGMILTQCGIIYDDPTSATSNRGSSSSPRPESTKQDPEYERGIPVSDGTQKTKTEKCPSYMKPLGCDRTRSINSQVAEAERFLSAPSMLRYIQATPSGTSTALALKSVREVNFPTYSLGEPLDVRTRVPPERIFQARKRIARRRTSDLSEIAESDSSARSESDIFGSADVAETTGPQKAGIFPVTKVLNRSTSDDQFIRKSDTVTLKRRPATHLDQTRSTAGPHVHHKRSVSTEMGGSPNMTAWRHSPISSHINRSHQKSPSFSATAHQISRKRKRRRKKLPTSPTRPPSTPFNTTEPAKDPRFTELTSLLVPDSARAFDLYRSMGRLSVLERMEHSGSTRKSGLRAHIGNIKKNRETLDTLF